MILSQNDVGFPSKFARAMQYPSKFQNICYGAQGLGFIFKMFLKLFPLTHLLPPIVPHQPIQLYI
jgi:hypothetical protein